MSEETKVVERTEKESELSDKDLDKVAGGATYSTTKSNIKGSLAPITQPTVPSRSNIRNN
jgi:hypothetical protein